MGRKTAAATHILLVLWAICPFAYGADSAVSPLPEPPSAPPDFVFLADYEDGYHPFGNPWGELIHQGGVLEIIADPTFSVRGNVQRSAIGDKRYPPIEERPQILVYRLYPGVFFPFKPAPLKFS